HAAGVAAGGPPQPVRLLAPTGPGHGRAAGWQGPVRHPYRPLWRTEPSRHVRSEARRTTRGTRRVRHDSDRAAWNPRLRAPTADRPLARPRHADPLVDPRL